MWMKSKEAIFGLHIGARGSLYLSAIVGFCTKELSALFAEIKK
jgi:hypothetical protein